LVFESLQKWAKVEERNTKWIIEEVMKNLSDEEREELKTLICDQCAK
jgi:hypothetical protein